MGELKKAEKAAKAAHEALYYRGVCSVVEYRDITDETTKITRQEEVTVLEGQPCNLSFEKLDSAVRTDTAAAVSQGLKLFISPDITIKSGSKIIVTQNGITGEYALSGKSAVYSGHQEINLELFRGWA